MSREGSQVEDEGVEDLRNQLKSFLSDQVKSAVITERDMMILSLRLGLNDKKCYTLIESSRILSISPECIRQRQHLLLRRKIKDPLFFKLLGRYSQLKRLPRGCELYYPPYTLSEVIAYCFNKGNHQSYLCLLDSI